jgi:hypothetical protein
MKLFSQLITLLLLITSAACSKEEPKTQAQAASPKADTGIIRTETNRIDTAKKALEDSKKVNQTILDSAAQQRETIEKTQQ